MGKELASEVWGLEFDPQNSHTICWGWWHAPKVFSTGIGKGRGISRVNFLVRLAYLVSYRPIRYSFFRGVEKRPESDIRHCPLVAMGTLYSCTCIHMSTHTCLHMNTHTCLHMSTHTCIHPHALKENYVKRLFYTICEGNFCWNGNQENKIIGLWTKLFHDFTSDICSSILISSIFQ